MTNWIVVHQVKDDDGPEPPEVFVAQFGFKEYAMKWLRELQRLGADRLGLYREDARRDPVLARSWGKFDDKAAW